MIHSLCGGQLKDNGVFTVIKVRFKEENFIPSRPYWFICDIVGIKAGDIVLAPFQRDEQLFPAEVIRVDEMINEQTLPMPLKMMKRVNKKA